MSRFLLALLLCTIVVLAVWNLRTRFIVPATASATPVPTSEDRVANARALREGKLRDLCKFQNVSYPPKELFLRAMKREQKLEVWAGETSESLHLIATYPLTAYSGRLGPKRREGDLQIPEGVYHIDRFNPRSSYHLSMGLNYPNSSDRQFADPERPGSDIFIHGRAASVGCLAIGDEAIEELYVLAADFSEQAKRQIPVHIYPARMDDPGWNPQGTDEAKDNPDLLTFWNNLASIYLRFELTRSTPNVVVDDSGRYQLYAETN